MSLSISALLEEAVLIPGFLEGSQHGNVLCQFEQGDNAHLFKHRGAYAVNRPSAGPEIGGHEMSRFRIGDSPTAAGRRAGPITGITLKVDASAVSARFCSILVFPPTLWHNSPKVARGRRRFSPGGDRSPAFEAMAPGVVSYAGKTENLLTGGDRRAARRGGGRRLAGRAAEDGDGVAKIT